jgi:hypothetical protein
VEDPLAHIIAESSHEITELYIQVWKRNTNKFFLIDPISVFHDLAPKVKIMLASYITSHLSFMNFIPAFVKKHYLKAGKAPLRGSALKNDPHATAGTGFFTYSESVCKAQ